MKALSSTVSTDRIIIAGAGPVGCTAALLLARAGLPVVLLEAEADLPSDLRASTFHPPTLDMLAEIGLTQKMIPQGLIATRYQYRDRVSGKYAEFDLRALTGLVDNPFRLQCEQFKLTRMVVDMLREYRNAEVMLGTRVEGVEQSSTGVKVLAKKGDEPVELIGRYLIATDGARSTIRRALGIEFEGFTYPEQFLVVSTAYPLDRHFDNLAEVNYVSDPEDWCTILKVPGSWRILFPAPIGLSDEHILSSDAIEARLQRLAPKGSPYELLHRSLYRIHQRVAKQYRSGNVFLAGDAAHVNNPLGGMGMNGGLHDAFNLCSKLIRVMQGADDSLLDLYDRQRRTVTIEYIQAQTIQNKENIENADGEARVRRIEKLQEIAANPKKSVAFLRRNNMLDSLERSNSIT